VSPVPRARWRDELAQAQVPASLRPMKATLLALVPLMTTTGELYVWRDRMVKATAHPEPSPTAGRGVGLADPHGARGQRSPQQVRNRPALPEL